MWCKIILAALLEIRELYSMEWRIAIYGSNSKNTDIAGLHTARGVRLRLCQSLVLMSSTNYQSVGTKTLGPSEIE